MNLKRRVVRMLQLVITTLPPRMTMALAPMRPQVTAAMATASSTPMPTGCAINGKSQDVKMPLPATTMQRPRMRATVFMRMAVTIATGIAWRMRMAMAYAMQKKSTDVPMHARATTMQQPPMTMDHATTLRPITIAQERA